MRWQRRRLPSSGGGFCERGSSLDIALLPSARRSPRLGVCRTQHGFRGEARGFRRARLRRSVSADGDFRSNPRPTRMPCGVGGRSELSSKCARISPWRTSGAEVGSSLGTSVRAFPRPSARRLRSTTRPGEELSFPHLRPLIVFSIKLRSPAQCAARGRCGSCRQPYCRECRSGGKCFLSRVTAHALRARHGLVRVAGSGQQVCSLFVTPL